MAVTPPFSIGSRFRWPGLAKVIEETSELGQILAKLIAYPEDAHPDGTDLIERLQDELGDSLAAIDYFIESNNSIRKEAIIKRADEKTKKFRAWDAAERSS